MLETTKTFLGSLIMLGIMLLLFSFLTNLGNAEAQEYSNKYGKLIVYPDISREIIRQKQYYSVQWLYPQNNLDIAFCFNNSLSYGAVYYFNGQSYIKLDFSHIEYNNKHWYILQNINFKQNETKTGYWEYDIPINTSGKWDLYAKLSSDSIQQALQTGRYIHLDPWYNSSWKYNKKITLTNPNDDQQYKLNITKSSGVDINLSSHCNDNFSDIRIVRTGNTTTLPIFYDYVSSGNYCHIWFCNSYNDTTLYIYYGNTNASLLDEPSKVFQFWEDWRTTNYLSSYSWVNRTTPTYGSCAYKTISNSFNSGKMYIMNWSYYQQANTWNIVSGYLQIGLSDDNSAFHPNNNFNTFYYSDSDDVIGEDGSDIAFQERVKKTSTGTNSATTLLNNQENNYLKTIHTVNSSKSELKIFSKLYYSLYSLSLTTNLPTDTDYIWYQTNSESSSSVPQGIHYSTNKLIIYELRNTGYNETVFIYWFAVGNFTDDKTTFSVGVETPYCPPVTSHINDIIPYNVYNNTINITVDIDSGYAKSMTLYYMRSYNNVSFPVSWSIYSNKTGYPYYFIIDFTNLTNGYYRFTVDAYNNESIAELPHYDPVESIHKFISIPQPLDSGGKWKLCSLPKNEIINRTDVFIYNETNNYTWIQAVNNDIIENFTFGWNGNLYTENTTFTMYKGYWIYFYHNDYSLWINTTSNISINSTINEDDLILSGGVIAMFSITGFLIVRRRKNGLY